MQISGELMRLKILDLASASWPSVAAVSSFQVILSFARKTPGSFSPHGIERQTSESCCKLASFKYDPPVESLEGSPSARPYYLYSALSLLLTSINQSIMC